MVAALGLGKFYGGSLPRPRFYSDGERIDPPLPVMDPLIAWAEEAHWSMGGVSTTRRRFQGRIEGNVGKLRVQRDDALFKKSGYKHKSLSSPAPAVIKRRRLAVLVDDEEEDKQSVVEKLGGKNERSAKNNGGGKVGRVVATGKRIKAKAKESDLPAVQSSVVAAVASDAGIRSSPRSAKIERSR
ncbi:hypothetical protein SASPL_113917 [Salvia splendens]|uniref:Uncharacterized protein n=1 Tax=Salvia splendens TaxID=180675 RepID=A0A8X8Y0D5_SALSN|nr:uncharacterized protein LOC121803334 [Salvia splendens]KAG6423518.1 hypothetical protein SASPL_113917 [Salvia splendens]